MTKFFLPVRFTYSTLRDQNARVADDETARLDQNFQAERLQQWQQFFRVTRRRQNAFCRGRLPPRRRAAGQRRIVNDAQAAAGTEKFQLVFRRQFLHQRQDFFHRQLVRRHRASTASRCAFAGRAARCFSVCWRGHKRASMCSNCDAEFVFVSAGGDFRVRVRPRRSGSRAPRWARSFSAAPPLG